jgi:hypothetical protein
MILFSCGLSKGFGFHHFTNRIDSRQKSISNVNGYVKMTRYDNLVLDFQDLMAALRSNFQQKSGVPNPSLFL